MDPRIAEEAEAFAELFEETGSLFLSAFLDACLSGYDGKIDYRDFTEAEREELLVNACRVLEIIEQSGERQWTPPTQPLSA